MFFLDVQDNIKEGLPIESLEWKLFSSVDNFMFHGEQLFLWALHKAFVKDSIFGLNERDGGKNAE